MENIRQDQVRGAHNDESDAMREEVELLQNKIAQLKGKIKKSDGEINLLRFRLTKAGKNSINVQPTANNNSLAYTHTSDALDYQSWVQHHICWTKVMSCISKPTVEPPTNDTLEASTGSCFVTSATVIADLKLQVASYKRLNDRLEGQLKAWVDTQVLLHKELAMGEAKAMYVKQLQHQPVEAASEWVTETKAMEQPVDGQSSPVQNPVTVVAPAPVSVVADCAQKNNLEQTPVPAVRVNKDVSTQKLLRAFACSPISATPAQELIREVDTVISQSAIVHQRSATVNPAMDARRMHENNQNVVLSTQDAPRGRGPTTLKSRLLSKDRSPTRRSLSDITNSLRQHHLENYDLEDSVLFNFKSSPFSTSVVHVPASAASSGVTKSRSAASQPPVRTVSKAPPGLLVELTPSSFQKEMNRMHRENISIKDDIARFRRNLQVRMQFLYYSRATL